MIEELQLSCALNNVDSYIPYLLLRLHNSTEEPVHIFDSPRMPYFMLQEDGSLVILFGLNPPDPEIDYGMIEIPTTQPVLPGEAVCRQVSLDSVILKDHYGAELEPVTFQGAVPVAVQFGWGTTAVNQEDRFRLNIYELLAWQRLLICQAGILDFS